MQSFFSSFSSYKASNKHMSGSNCRSRGQKIQSSFPVMCKTQQSRSFANAIERGPPLQSVFTGQDNLLMSNAIHFNLTLERDYQAVDFKEESDNSRKIDNILSSTMPKSSSPVTISDTPHLTTSNDGKASDKFLNLILLTYIVLGCIQYMILR